MGPAPDSTPRCPLPRAGLEHKEPRVDGEDPVVGGGRPRSPLICVRPFWPLMGGGLTRGPPGHPLPPGSVKVQDQEKNELPETPAQDTDTVNMSSTGLLRLRRSKVGREASVRLGAQLAARICCTQLTRAVTRAYTPGVDVEHVLLPQDTMPTRVQAPFFLQTRGPPESPCRTGRGRLGAGSPETRERCSQHPVPGRTASGSSAHAY